jgi:two-component system sensor histidine kinase/response regulator
MVMIVKDGIIAIVAICLIWLLRRAIRQRDRRIAKQRAAAAEPQELNERLKRQIIEQTEKTAHAREVALATEQLRSEFLDNMSHELLTPLNGIVGMARLLLDAGLTDEQREYADAVLASSQALRVIVEDVLDFSKLSQGQYVLEERKFDLHDSMERVAAQFVRQAQKRGINLTLELDENLPRLVTGDAHRLAQILSNLVSNAVKFSNDGQIAIRARQIDGSAHDSMLSFEVSDTGIGIAADRESVIFQPFAQVDGSASRNYGG